jgi:hypothetical protein
LIKHVPEVRDLVSAIEVSSWRARRFITVSAPHWIIEELPLLAGHGSREFLCDGTIHYAVKAVGPRHSVIERVHVQVTNYEGSG